VKKRFARKQSARYLNVGCGSRYHADWCNIDLVASGKEVIEFDIRRGLPFDDNTFDAVYHSHVLEHLTPEQGERLVRECGRVLAPGGILRIVVPDLERITALYLKMLKDAWNGDPAAQENYEWMKL
jgi:predicted SAM-dependent methyltransferase